jgi:hypothetical protein
MLLEPFEECGGADEENSTSTETGQHVYGDINGPDLHAVAVCHGGNGGH